MLSDEGLSVDAAGDAVVVQAASQRLLFPLVEPVLKLGEALRVRVGVRANGGVESFKTRHLESQHQELARIVDEGEIEGVGTLIRTFECFRTGNVHVNLRIELNQPLDEGVRIELPAITLEPQPASVEHHVDWYGLDTADSLLTCWVKKYPWKASWNDVGSFDHMTLPCSVSRHPDGLAFEVMVSRALFPGDSIDASIVLHLSVPGGQGAADRAGAEEEWAYGLEEARYVPLGEYRHSLTWETAEGWQGPPITEGCRQRPADQLIERPAGLNVLARKRFNWNNEDFGLWRLTGKRRYYDSGIKKAEALVRTQNEYGGWFEGVEFYNLPPRHHQMYDTYIGGLFLLEAYDVTGDDRYLRAALRCRDFWTGDPPANGHTVVGNGGWWYRWGGYINEFGYTDERHVLNTHAGATAFLTQLYERTKDEGALEAATRGIDAFKWGLEQGIQKGSGQFYYSLSQARPLLELPGDPPYVELNLIPQIEDVYTIASSYRMMLANRHFRDERVTEAITKALEYWLVSLRTAHPVTYRAYAVITYAVAAGEIDPRYALVLPDLLKDRDNYTSMQRGASSFVAPHGHPIWRVLVPDSSAAAAIEPVFLKRTTNAMQFAVVNMEFPRSGVEVLIDGIGSDQLTHAEALDPASGDREELQIRRSQGDGVVVQLPELRELQVAVIDVNGGGSR